MSKRFGRNRKRAMRAELEQAHTELDRTRTELRVLYELTAQNRDLADGIRELLPLDNILNDPCEVEERYPWDRLARMREIDPHVTIDDSHEAVLSDIETMTQALMVLRYDHETRERLSNARHFYFTWRGVPYAYAVSEDALALIDRKGLARRIGHELGNLIAQNEGNCRA